MRARAWYLTSCLWLSALGVASCGGDFELKAAGEICVASSECGVGLTCDFGVEPPVCSGQQTPGEPPDPGPGPDAAPPVDAGDEPNMPDAASPPDAAPLDAAPPIDAPPPDAAPPDAAPPDAAPPDAAPPDAAI